MTREEAIKLIEALYPADSIYPDTAEVGRELLAEAKDRVNYWRSEPDDVIFEYARLCKAREDAMTRESQLRQRRAY